MHARDATGRQVSLLNDDSAQYISQRPLPQRPLSYQSAFSHPSPSSRSNSSSPHMPELSRADSYDSQTSTDPISPMTPSVDYAFARTSLYSIGQDYESQSQPKRPVYGDNSRSTSYADDEIATTAMPERTGKRYPCRYRESHGCEKTFTTSGHASRHSKIHTAEKAVQCTYSGCQKKFTRADNMKQHLETHYKDKSRSSSGSRAHKAALAESRRNTSTGRHRSGGRDGNQWETEQFALPTPPIPSPQVLTSGAVWDMHGANLPLLNRPGSSRMPSSGLDALAMAVACQEGGGR